MKTDERRHILVGHTSNVNMIDFTRDSRYLLSAANNHTIRLWDVESGRCTRVFQRHSGAVPLISVISDKQAVSASRDGTIVVWDLASGQPVGSTINYRAPHYRKSAFATSPNGRYIAAVVSADLVDEYQPSKDSVMLKVWDLTTRDPQGVLHGEVSDPRVRMSNHKLFLQ
jgi:WD40 repeat protein